jgi:hypothetical protein
MKSNKSLFAILIVMGILPIFAQERQTTVHNLMPVPASIHFTSGRLAISPSLSIAIKGHSDTRLMAAIDRAMRRLEARTGLTLSRGKIKD